MTAPRHAPFEGKPVGVALVGCGRVAPAHLQAIIQQPSVGTVVAIVDVDRARADKLAAAVPGAKVFTSIAEAVALDAVEAVDICLPNASHADAAVLSLAARKHVLVEKPMADSVEDAERMAIAAETSNLILSVAQSQRHHPISRFIQDRLPSYGRLRTLEVSNCIRWDGPQTAWWQSRSEREGIVLPIFGPHALDFIQMIMGDEDPVHVRAVAIREQNNWAGEDEAMAILRYPDRRLAYMHISYNQRPFFKRKTMLFDNCIVEVINDSEVRMDGKVIATGSEAMTSEQLAKRAFENQFEEFARAVRGLPHRSVLHKEGMRQIRTLHAIRREAATFPIT